MNRGMIWWGATAALAVSVISAATARPGYLGAFKNHYKTATGKPKLNAANCALCHIGMPNQARWNAYGNAFGKALGAKQVGDMAKLAAAFAASEKETNPATKETYATMIAADVMPGGATAAGGGTSTPNTGATAVATGEWEAVFNGVNLDGWTKMGGGNWTVENFMLKYTGGGNGWVRTNKMYTNYSAVIRFRFTQPGAANDTGFFLKARQGDNGSPLPNSPQLHAGPNQNFGALLNKPTRFDLIKPNDWNVYTITVDNGLASVAINGTPAWDYAMSDALKGAGYLGIEAAGRPFEIDQFWVRPLR